MTDQPETPKILDQISKGTNASVTRKQQNARRRFIIVLVPVSYTHLTLPTILLV